MERLSLNRNGPKAFILVPDGEFSIYDPLNDQVWALCLDSSDTSPFYLQTTYQLRAKSMRIFPNIISNHRRLNKTSDFTLLPQVTSYTPATITLKYGLLNHLDITFTCFISEPDVLVGTLELHNSSTEKILVDGELGAVLIPMGQGSPTHPEKYGANQVLCGQTDDLFPVLFMSSSPRATSNPHPALRAELTIDPGRSATLHWALVSKTNHSKSFETARKLATPAWQRTAQVHIKNHDRNMVHIRTGQPDWDAAFTLAQVNAMTHLVDPDPDQKQPIFTRQRLPDQPTQSQTEIDNLEDLTLLDAAHLAQVMLPVQADHFKNLLLSFAAQVDDQGRLPSRIFRGLSGGAINEPPTLANLCLQLFEINEDRTFLREVFPALRRFFDAGWFAGDLVNPDNFPSWQSPAQLQLSSGLFTFDPWEPTGRGLDIRTAESPALAAMLGREAFALQKIARILGDRTARSDYARVIKVIHEKVHSMWNENLKVFAYQDRQTHQAPNQELYDRGSIQASLEIHKKFNQPQRLQIHLSTDDERTRACVIQLVGKNEAGESLVEKFSGSQVRWMGGQAHLTTHNLFSELNSIEFEGFTANDRFIIETADYTQVDISCLLPLWTGKIPNDLLESMVETHLIASEHDFDIGIPETWPVFHPLPDALPKQINIMWNTLIIDGLIREGYAQEAVNTFTNMMNAIILSLKNYNGFYPVYDITGGYPQGKANTITGLAPLGLCLKIAGIKLFNPNRVAVIGENLFSWPIEVHWQGLSVHRQGAQTRISFPDGTQYHSQSTKPQMVQSN